MQPKTELLMNDQQQFRDAMARLSAAVTVITTDGASGKRGMTATSVCSVTDTPPTVLVCIKQSALMNHAVKNNKQVCINILDASQKNLAKQFAGELVNYKNDNFTDSQWISCKHHQFAPYSTQALVCVHGEINQIVEIGTHSVFFVLVQKINIQTDSDALLYYQRQYKKLALK